MKEKLGTDSGFDQPRRMLSAGGRIEPKETSFARNIKVRALSHLVSADSVAQWFNLYKRTNKRSEQPGANR